MKKNYELPPDIKKLVRELGHAKRSELSKSNLSLTSLSREPVSVNPMGTDWTEAQDFVLFMASKKNIEDMEKIAAMLPNRTAEQCRLRWNYLNAPPQIKKKMTEPKSEPPKQPTPDQSLQALLDNSFNLTSNYSMNNFDEFFKNFKPDNCLPNRPATYTPNPQPGPSSQLATNEDALFNELFNNGTTVPNPRIPNNLKSNNYFDPQNTGSLGFNVNSQFQNNPLFNAMNFETSIPSGIPQTNQVYAAPQKTEQMPEATVIASQKRPHEPTLEEEVSSNNTTSVKEKIVEIANLLRQNPQLVPVIQRLSEITSQLPREVTADELLKSVELSSAAESGYKQNTFNSSESHSYPRRGVKRPTTNSISITPQSAEATRPNNYTNDLLLYQFATQELPEEIDGDDDFVNKDYTRRRDVGDQPVVTNKELNDLFDDYESSAGEEIGQQNPRPKAATYKMESPLFSLEILNRIRSQQQQNLQLVLQAYAIECRFRGPESEKAVYWKSQAMYIKKLNDYGQLSTSTSLDISAIDPDDNRAFISFLKVPGAEYMGAMLETIANPPESIMNSCHVGGPSSSKSKLPILSMRKRDWAVYFPEKDFIAPNSPKNVVDKARIISILVDEIFMPIFDKRLKPFFTIIKKRDRPIFIPAEDSLFTIGLYKFGDDWASIRSHLLPPRTSRQLENRFNNLKSRRAQYTPIQQYYLRQIKPLTLDEEERLTQGVRAYGRKFRIISQRMIPNRPSFVLKRAWKEMEDRKYALKKPVFLDNYP
ncbi:hypothetical protein DSO57_1019014 [Entomophthora muscae]|uniref:Uncharacterized protein n=1 Tax=Entomophthora muscae TaxID=34485 RepID=A0ACC2RVF3_9FUNG|nr:hypothetical protein DSO57_1019014 [Entomophthora muscae]